VAHFNETITVANRPSYPNRKASFFEDYSLLAKTRRNSSMPM
jgi:hypothetical protein